MNLYRYLATPESHGKKIGLFRIITAIFGGLVLSYLSLCVLVALNTPFKQDLAVIALLYNTLAWAATALWIALAPTKLGTLLRFVLPTLIVVGILGWLYE